MHNLTAAAWQTKKEIGANCVFTEFYRESAESLGIFYLTSRIV